MIIKWTELINKEKPVSNEVVSKTTLAECTFPEAREEMMAFVQNFCMENDYQLSPHKMDRVATAGAAYLLYLINKTTQEKVEGAGFNLEHGLGSSSDHCLGLEEHHFDILAEKTFAHAVTVIRATIGAKSRAN